MNKSYARLAKITWKNEPNSMREADLRLDFLYWVNSLGAFVTRGATKHSADWCRVYSFRWRTNKSGAVSDE